MFEINQQIDSKLGLIDQFLSKADYIIIGGGMAFTFLKAKGKEIGGSLVDDTMIQTAKNIINKARVQNVKLLLPKAKFSSNFLILKQRPNSSRHSLLGL